MIKLHEMRKHDLANLVRQIRGFIMLYANRKNDDPSKVLAELESSIDAAIDYEDTYPIAYTAKEKMNLGGVQLEAGDTVSPGMMRKFIDSLKDMFDPVYVDE